MAVTGVFHHIASFLLFSAAILLLVTDITAPVIDHLSIMKVRLANATDTHETAVTFGSFGYCTIHTLSGDNYCSHSHIGYSPVAVLVSAGATSSSDDSDSSDSVDSISDVFSTTNTKVIRNLTKVMILHPIATGIVFLACLLGLAAGVCGSFMGSFVGMIGFLVTLVALVVDFVLFAIVHNKINDDDNDTGATASYGPGIWTVVASAVCSLLGTLLLFFSCCSGRMHQRRDMMPDKPVTAAVPQTGRFFFRR